VFGTMVSDARHAGTYLKIDERPFRTTARQGSADCYTASGREVAADKAAFEAGNAALERPGIEMHHATDAGLARAPLGANGWLDA
jgi:hypothetical protein